MRQSYRPENLNGSTLIEILISIIILAVMLITSGAAIFQSRRTIVAVGDQQAALGEAIRIIEIARNSTEFKTIDTLGTIVRVFEDPSHQGQLTLDPQTNWQVNINGQWHNIEAELETVDVDALHLNELRVQVGYTDTLNITMQSRFSNF